MFPGARYGKVGTLNKSNKIIHVHTTFSRVQMRTCNVCFPECDYTYAFKAPFTLYRIASELPDFHTGFGCCLHALRHSNPVRGVKVNPLWR